MIAVDTSVAIAAFASWHGGHHAALRVLAREPRLPAHAAIETYSVLTRLPPPHRAPHEIVTTYLDRVFPPEFRILPDDETLRTLPKMASAAGIDGGRIYDALIAMTARDAGATLVTRDRRALPIYRVIGVDVEVNE